MSATTGIQWTDATWNPVVGCEKVSQGCKFCYAKTIHDMRHAAYHAGKAKIAEQYRMPFESIQLKPDRLLYPVRWAEPRKIFTNSVSDLFHHAVPDSFIDQVMVVVAFTRRHIHQLLTKRPERGHDYFAEMTSGSESSKDRWDIARRWLVRELAKPGPGSVGVTPRRRRRFERDKEYIGVIMADTWLTPIPNLWYGTSVENERARDERLPFLINTPGVGRRWMSAEPLLSDLGDLTDYLDGSWLAGPDGTGGCRLDWVVVGGESGTRKQDVRPMNPDWARSIRDQCVSAGVPFLFKQWGEYVNIDPPGSHSAKVGTRRAGRELDGRTWDEYPSTREAR